MGLVVEVAENGQVAIQMVQDTRYDMVLMDMQMPVMDGPAATAGIRQVERLADLPIVAMTANAMRQDRDKCMRAGMNDFLSKPIHPGDLREMLLKWVKPAAGRVKAAPHRPVPAAIAAIRAGNRAANSQGDPFDGIEGLDTRAGLSRMSGKKPLYIAMLRRFVAGQKDIPRQVRVSLGQGDRKSALRMVHTVKGLAGTVGALEIQSRAAELEVELDGSAAGDQLEQALCKMEMPLRDLIATLESRFSGEPAASHA
jgi:two-component system sensor histidine kinase/response regulator